LSSGKKIRKRNILKESVANYISLESLINVNFGKNMNRQFFLVPQRKIGKMTMRHSFNQTNEIIGYQNSADFCEIWPEHSFEDVKQKCVGDF